MFSAIASGYPSKRTHPFFVKYGSAIALLPYLGMNHVLRTSLPD
ncbi:hypothetical protein MC7420_4762 [Coleofasciculus chthonoplastes PCC 7420]|uniref:Uncharacterized protein n=1 Tax=Coleofasciculus chthonoplastes PCC 7420 TaxID=118168 RepID=B4VNC9_9CYAN|nr:hypothetical protein MC7420_4762 [Coleofasciculus chthonoplastes PCC 7420]